MVETHVKESKDLPAGSDYQDKRKERPGRKAYEKAPPEACAIRPMTIKLVGMEPQEGEVQGTLEHVLVIANKYRTFFHGVIEWIEVEGVRYPPPPEATTKPSG